LSPSGSTRVPAAQATKSTFSLNTASREWTRHGDWRLPHRGQAHYADDLGAWVGIRTVYNEETNCEHEHLCFCDVPVPLDGSSTMPMPAWRAAKERLTFIDPSLTPMYGRTLLPTGGTSVFCLVEHALRLEVIDVSV
jgi:hypothetical protein